SCASPSPTSRPSPPRRRPSPFRLSRARFPAQLSEPLCASPSPFPPNAPSRYADLMREVVILSAARTPVGKFLGGLSSLTAPELAAIAIKAALARAGISPDQVDGTIMRNVLPAGVGLAPARRASIKAGIP